LALSTRKGPIAHQHEAYLGSPVGLESNTTATTFAKPYCITGCLPCRDCLKDKGRAGQLSISNIWAQLRPKPRT
jgi:hypothetical protein